MTTSKNALYFARRARECAESNDWEECLRACRDGLALDRDTDLDSWVTLRFGLAAATLNVDNPPSELVEQAIREAQRVASSERLPLLDERRGAAFRYMGGLFGILSVGTRQSNLTSVIDCYQKATGVYREDRFPEEWALLQLCIAIALQKRLRALGLSFLRSSAIETGLAIESLEDSIAACKDALRVYQAEGDRRREAQDLIASALKMMDEIRGDQGDAG